MTRERLRSWPVARVRRPDLEAAWTAAAVLDVRLDDVFSFEQTPDSDGRTPTADGSDPAIENDVLNPEQSRRLRALYALQAGRTLTEDEWAGMDELVAAWSLRTYERGVRDIAEGDGRSVEQVMTDLAAQRDHVAEWYRGLEADPARREALVQEALERQRARATG